MTALVSVSCKSDIDKLATLRVQEPLKARYCAAKVPPSTTVFKTEKAMLKCIRTVTKDEFLDVSRNPQNYTTRQERWQQAEQELIAEVAEMQRQDMIAKDELQLIQAKINVNRTEDNSDRLKLIYCRTKPEMRLHGYRLAEELTKLKKKELKMSGGMNSRLFAELQPIRSSEVLSCFEKATKLEVDNFFSGENPPDASSGILGFHPRDFP